MNGRSITKLTSLIDKNFDLGELRLLCTSLDVSFENIDGSTRELKALDLVEYMKRRDRLPELLTAIKRARPHLAAQVDALETDLPRDPLKIRMPIGWILTSILVIAAGVVLWLGVNQLWGNSNATPPASATMFLYQVRVLDQETGKVINQANVALDLPGTLPIDTFTDGNGLAALNVQNEFEGETLQLRVSKDGYQDWDQFITIRAGQRPYEVRLAP